MAEQPKQQKRICEVCNKNEAKGVAAVPGVPYSAAYCQTCLDANAHPWPILVSGTACIGGGLDKAAVWWIKMIKDTCKHLNRSMYEFSCAVALAERMLDNKLHDTEISKNQRRKEKKVKKPEKGKCPKCNGPMIENGTDPHHTIGTHILDGYTCLLCQLTHLQKQEKLLAEYFDREDPGSAEWGDDEGCTTIETAVHVLRRNAKDLAYNRKVLEELTKRAIGAENTLNIHRGDVLSLSNELVQVRDDLAEATEALDKGKKAKRK